MRVDREGNRTGFFDNMSDRSIVVDDWGFYEIVGDVDEDVAVINIGMLLQRSGTAYLDGATLEDLGKPVALNEPPRPLTPPAVSKI